MVFPLWKALFSEAGYHHQMTSYVDDVVAKQRQLSFLFDVAIFKQICRSAALRSGVLDSASPVWPCILAAHATWISIEPMPFLCPRSKMVVQISCDREPVTHGSFALILVQFAAYLGVLTSASL